jgi:serine/threonine protein kinase
MNCPKCAAILKKDATTCESCGAQAVVISEPPDPFVGQILDKKYIVKKKLGGGGFGAVYLAEEPGFDRKVAIKTLHSQHTINPTMVGRFQREGMAASKLEHPCAVKMFNYGKTPDGIPWLAMEFIEGETLGDRMDRDGPLSPQMLLTIFGPICEVLEEAHERGIIHRDLKPDNIMLISSRGKVQPKLLDFGIAALLDDPNELTKTGVMSGTPTYMPPEQWEGLKATDARSDIYSLGFILYQCLAGRLPFTAASTPGWIRKHCFEPAPVLTSVAPAISEALSEVVMKTITKSPDERYQSMSELRLALQACIPLQTENLLSGPLPLPSFDHIPTFLSRAVPTKQPTPPSLSATKDFDKITGIAPPTEVDSSIPKLKTYDLIDEVEAPSPSPIAVVKETSQKQTSLVLSEVSPQNPELSNNLQDLSSPISPPSTSKKWIFVGIGGLALLTVVELYAIFGGSTPNPATAVASLPTQPTTVASQSLPTSEAITPQSKKYTERFILNEDQTVTDTTTGLIWAASDNGENITYDDALKSMASKGPNWRMPTVTELKELYRAGIRKGTGTIKLTGHYIWADHTNKPTTLDYDCLKEKACTDDAWTFVIAFNNGNVFRNRRSVYNGRVLLVRSSE